MMGSVSVPLTLPHGMRPAVGTSGAMPAGAGDTATSFLLLAGVMLLGLGWLWWQGRAARTTQGTAQRDTRDRWTHLASTVGQPDWYQRLGETLVREHGDGSGPGAWLAKAAARDATGGWGIVARHWEWAVYAGHTGSAEVHASDLALVRRGPP